MTTRKRPGRPSKSMRRRMPRVYGPQLNSEARFDFCIGGGIATFNTPNPSPKDVEMVRKLIEAVQRIGPENLPSEAK